MNGDNDVRSQIDSLVSQLVILCYGEGRMRERGLIVAADNARKKRIRIRMRLQALLNDID